MKNRLFLAATVFSCLTGLWIACAPTERATQSTDNSQLSLPAGFSGRMLIDSIGKARHLAVTAQGDIFVKLEDTVKGAGIVVLHDNGDDATVKSSFGKFGGTGIFIRNGYLYASSNEAVYRFWLNENGEVVDPLNPEVIVTGLIDRDQHESKSLVLDNAGNIYVNI